MKKWLLVLLLGIPLIIVIVLAVLYFSLNSIVQTAVVKIGSLATGTEVKLEHVSLSPLSGKGELSGFSVGNPEGFKTDSAFQLGNVFIELDTASLLTDTIIIRKVHIEGPVITYEQGIPRSNIHVIKNNVSEFAGPPKEEQPKDPAELEKRVIIEQLLVTGGMIRLSTTLVQGRAATIPMRDIDMRDLGKKTDGQAVQGILDEIFAVVTDVIGSTVGSSGALLKQGTDMLKEQAEGLKEQTETLNEKKKQISDGVKSIFGGKD